MNVRFYGRLAEVLGPQVEADVAPGSSVADVRRLVTEKFPGGAATLASARSKACVGGSIVGDHHMLSDGDAVEFLPPVSGG